MATQYATQVQIEAAREKAEQFVLQFQQLSQGSQRPTRVSSARLTELDALVTALKTAVDAINSAVVDNTPAAFTFVDITGAVVSTVYISNSITLSGLTDNVPVAITITGGTYSVNSGPWTASAGTVVQDDKIRVRVTSSASAATAVNGALTIGGVSDTYTVTTA